MGTTTTIPTIPEKFIPPDSSTITSGTGVGSAVGIAVEVGSGISVDAEEGSGTEVASTLVMVAGGAVTIIGAGTGVGGYAPLPNGRSERRRRLRDAGASYPG